MKIKGKEITEKNDILSMLILSCMNKDALNTVEQIKDRNSESEYEIQLLFNGVELDLRLFVKRLDEIWDKEVERACKPQAEKMFEEMKHKFMSSKSTNTQLNKLREQMVKITNQMQNISQNIEVISHNTKQD